MKKVIVNINSALRYLEEYPRDILVYRLTLLLLVFHYSPSWVGELPVRIAALFMFFSTNYSRNKWLWLLLLIGTSAYTLFYWQLVDNHKYLITYWVGVCFLSSLVENRIQFLKTNSHLLILLAFGFAVFWKITSSDFLNGHFMQYTLLTDSRMQYIATFAAGITENQFLDKKLLMEFLSSEPNLTTKVTLDSTSALRPLALVITYFTVGIELLVLFGFALKKNRFFNRIKDWSLQAFILFLYPLLPVTAFGFILSVLGIAQLEQGQYKKFNGYFIAIIIMQLVSELSILDFVKGDLRI